MKKIAIFINIFFLLFILFSCGMDDKKIVNIVRYDKTQYEYVEFDSFEALRKMQTDYLPMSKMLIEDILELGSIYETDITTRFKDYFRDSLLILINNDVEEKFENIESLEEELTDAFNELEKRFPGIGIPTFYTQLSALNESVIVGDTLIGISLDKYMGADYPPYKNLYYSYQRKSMSPENITADCLSAYLQSKFPYPDDYSRTLGAVMVYTGILDYIICDILNIDIKDYLSYNEFEKKWCEENERKVVDFMLKNRHLYSSSFMVARRYLSPNPYNEFFGKHSPGRLGHFIGYNIVKAYVKKFKVSEKELIGTRDSIILEKSNYLK